LYDSLVLLQSAGDLLSAPILTGSHASPTRIVEQTMIMEGKCRSTIGEHSRSLILP